MLKAGQGAAAIIKTLACLRASWRKDSDVQRPMQVLQSRPGGASTAHFGFCSALHLQVRICHGDIYMCL